MRLIFISSLIFIFGCSKVASEADQGHQTTEKIEKEEAVNSASLASITIYQKDVNHIEKDELEELDSSLITSIASYLGWSGTKIRAYTYKSISSNAKVILLNSIRGKSFYLLLHEESELIEVVNITKDQCRLMKQYAEYELIHCETKSASVNDIELIIFENKYEIKEYSDYTETVQDSLTYTFKIRNDIELIDIDSVRLKY
ncbi:hypothetical protein [Ekhidna sp.]|uniref:hypothetical protein n=1 Tax=Ekhidna sp. TaxID=2608089 RepID=UPI0032EE3A97